MQTLENLVQSVAQALASIDEDTAKFCAETQILCKPNCGACCSKPNGVWTTVGEMLPMAWDLHRTGQQEDILQKLESSNQNGVCALYDPNDTDLAKGRCTAYTLRPTICRLFGSSSRSSKNGMREFLGCSWLKDQNRDINQRVTALKDNKIADSHNLTMKVRALLNSSELVQELPINVALAKALKLIAWSSYINNYCRTESSGPSPNVPDFSQ